MHEYIIDCVNFLGFWNFPKTAWWEMNVRQATHPCQTNSEFLEKNRLAAAR